jgi:hypothetical protein
VALAACDAGALAAWDAAAVAACDAGALEAGALAAWEAAVGAVVAGACEAGAGVAAVPQADTTSDRVTSAANALTARTPRMVRPPQRHRRSQPRSFGTGPATYPGPPHGWTSRGNGVMIARLGGS